MTFPYPQNPEDWQTAYTRNQAFADSGKHANASSLALLGGTVAILVYIIIRLVPILNFTKYALYIWLAMAFALIVIVSLVFMFVQTGASCLAAHFFKEFYLPPDGVDPNTIINYRLYGKVRLPTPLDMFSKFEYILVKDGEIDKADKWAAWSARNIGGPILLTVFDGCALYLERGNRFSRVVGPGEKIPFLEWYETIKYVVDLRPKIKEGNFNVWTKDGIKVNLTARIECRIGDPAKKDPDSGLVYPYDPVAVKKAIERYALSWPVPTEEPKESTWIDAAWGQVTGVVPGYIGSRMLDDLLIAARKNGQILSPDALKELIEKMNKASSSFGVYITDFQIQKIEPPPEVDKQQKEYWKAEREGIATVKDGQATAYRIRTREKARADAQRNLILAIADGLEKNKEGQFTEPMLLLLSGVLDESLTDPITRANLAKETLDTLEKLRNLLGRNPSEG